MLTIKEFKANTGISITVNHTGKMSDLYSISTSPLCNDLCMKRAENKDCICHYCYSQNMNKFMKTLRENLIKNTDILTTRILSDEEIPYINAPLGMFREEAFGDLVNEIQVVNYFSFARLNPHCKVALWTKNPWIIESAIKKYNLIKPENLRIIGSSYFLNTPMTAFYKRYWFIDNVFTVYTKKFIAENHIVINCGGKSCASCRACYDGTHASYEINELLK